MGVALGDTLGDGEIDGVGVGVADTDGLGLTLGLGEIAGVGVGVTSANANDPTNAKASINTKIYFFMA